ncbi:MBL fold metallo-hydrolase [Vulgatibacter sp.]|uniref:MBL fold metallo-hydrolase n=1 Tax=Vulgatibacter sp. TaxID=1971226 RepID=UPI0035685ECA
MLAPRKVAGDTTCLGGYLPVPGLGLIACNAFLLQSTEPVLVDTGLLPLREQFLEQLRAELPLWEIRWIWLTHVDPDHTGALDAILQEAPKAKVITTFIGLAKLDLQMRAPPPERVYLLNAGERLDVGDRQLLAQAPPTFDAPETTGLLDSRTGAFFSADSFGAVLPEPSLRATDVDPLQLRQGCLTWARIDAPWLGMVDRAAFERSLEFVRRLAPPWVLSSHLPPAQGMVDTLLDHLADAPAAAPFVGPNQEAFLAMMPAS